MIRPIISNSFEFLYLFIEVKLTVHNDTGCFQLSAYRVHDCQDSCLRYKLFPNTLIFTFSYMFRTHFQVLQVMGIDSAVARYR